MAGTLDSSEVHQSCCYNAQLTQELHIGTDFGSQTHVGFIDLKEKKLMSGIKM
jgi:hypothetical protein